MYVSAKVRVVVDETGVNLDLRGLLTPAGWLMPLLDYCLTHIHDRSTVWSGKVVRATQMFLEYWQANPLEGDSHTLLLNFAQRLYSGTIDPKTGEDPSRLFWKPRSPQDARSILSNLTDFFEWLGRQRPQATQVNPKYCRGVYDRTCDEAAYLYRRDRALLGHIWPTDSPRRKNNRKLGGRRALNVESEPPRFPEDRFEDLLTKGFRVGDQYDYRGILITLLLDAGGFRESEVFHLYIEDVIPDPQNPKSALVRIHHPGNGFAPRNWCEANGYPVTTPRATYLAQRFGLVPRNQMTSTKRAGWKGGILDGKYYKQSVWFRPEMGELFLAVWRKYLPQVAMVDRSHPFAFVNLGREPIGDMYSLSQFNDAHANACRRIGLEPRKELGTTPHGHRHAYAKRLKRAEVPRAFIRKFMHHASPESQDVYTHPSSDEIRSELAKGVEKLELESSESKPKHIRSMLAILS